MAVNQTGHGPTVGWNTYTLYIPGGTSGISVGNNATAAIEYDPQFIAGPLPNPSGSYLTYNLVPLILDYCLENAGYMYYGAWNQQKLFQSNSQNQPAYQEITASSSITNDMSLAAGSSYTGMGSHIYTVTIDSTSPAQNTQTYTAAPVGINGTPGTGSSYFDTTNYDAIGVNSYKMSIISDSVFTPRGGTLTGHFQNGERIIGQTSGTQLKLIYGGADDFLGGAGLTQYISGTPDVSGHEVFIGQSSGATMEIEAFKYSNSAQLFKSSTQTITAQTAWQQITNLTGMVTDTQIIGVLQFAIVGNQFVNPSQIDNLQFVTTQVGGDNVGDYYLLTISADNVPDTFKWSIDGATPTAAQSNIPIPTASATATVGTVTGTFLVNEKVVGSISGATGFIQSIPNSTTINLTGVASVFEIGDVLTGATSGATAPITNVVQVGGNYTLSDGIIVTFVSDQGNTVGDYWDITVDQAITRAWANFYYTTTNLAGPGSTSGTTSGSTTTTNPISGAYRLVGQGFVFQLPSNFWTMGVQESQVYVNTQYGQWSIVTTAISADLQNESLSIVPLKQASSSKVIDPWMIGNMENDLVYVTDDHNLDYIGRLQLYQLPQIDNLSDPVKLDFLVCDFQNGSIVYIGKRLYISSPNQGVVLCYDELMKYWQTPKTFSEQGILSIIGNNLVAHSSSKNQSFTMFTNQNGDNGAPYTTCLRTPISDVPYHTRSGKTNLYYSNRWAQKNSNASFCEGYISGNPPLVHTVYLGIGGCGGIYSHNIVPPYICVPADRAPFGNGAFGSHPNGSDVTSQFPSLSSTGTLVTQGQSYFKEIYKGYAPMLLYDLISLDITCTTTRHSYTIISTGMNAIIAALGNNKWVNKSNLPQNPPPL